MHARRMLQRKSVKALAAAAAAVAAVAVTGTQVSLADNAPGAPSLPPVPEFPHLDHVFVIMMENHGTSTLLDPSNEGTPYIRSLAKTYGVAMHYDGVTDPSLPNYIAATSGSTWGMKADDTNQKTLLDHTNIVDQLEAHHVSWKAYMESAPYPGYQGGRYQPPDGSGAYAPAHNPFMMYPDIYNNPERANRVVPLTQLDADIRANAVPQYSWITPNICNDMHLGPGCYGVSETQLEKLGDDFLRKWVTAIQGSSAWTGNSAIFITWDEGPGGEGCCDSPTTGSGDLTQATVDGGGNVPMIVVARHGARGYSNTTPYNHYSLLRTIEANWDLGYLGYAADDQEVHSLTPFLTPASPPAEASAS